MLEFLMLSLLCGAVFGSVENDCFGVSGEPGSLLCRAMPSVCDLETQLFLKDYTRIVFDLENLNSIDSDELNNCTFSWSDKIELHFKNVKKISEFAFENVRVEAKVSLTIKLDGSGLDLDKSGLNKRLSIKKNAFHALQLRPRSQLVVEIVNYKHVMVEDSMIASIWQQENSIVHLNVRNVDEIIFTPLSELDTDSSKKGNKQFKHDLKHHEYFKQNKSFSIDVSNVNYFHIDYGIFSSLQIDSYSNFMILIRYVQICYLSESAFEGLQLDAFAQFNLIVENANSVNLGRNLFNRLQLGASANFFFQLDQIGDNYSKNDESEGDYYNESTYDDEENNDDASKEDEASDFSNSWFCVPEGFFRGVELAESSVAQIHFTQFDASIHVNPKAFDEIQLNENAKFQILFENLKSHVILASKAVNLVRVSNGVFELWIERHKQKNHARGNPAFINESSLETRKKPKSLDDLLKKARYTYFKLNDDAFFQIFLSPRSLFRLGFSNSDSVFSLEPRAINTFHEDRFVADIDPDYRTKISIELKDSDYFGFETKSDDYQNLPRVIEIDAYQPSVSMLSADGTVDLALSLSNLSTKRGGGTQRNLVSTDSYLANEFCRFYKTKSLINNGHSLVYFSEPIRQSAKLDPSSRCTSCLLIYLYHGVHQRADFYFIKDHLPTCFHNLHYHENMYFKSMPNSSRKADALQQIDASFKHYWSKLRCEAISGASDFTQHEFMGRWCGRNRETIEIIQQTSDMKICSKTVFNSTTKTEKIKKPIQQNKKRPHSAHLHHSFNWALFVALMCSSMLVFSVFLLLKYSNRPCFFRINSNFRRLKNNSTTVSYNNNETVEGKEFDVENYDGYEYDDDFEVNKKETELNESVASNEDEKKVGVKESFKHLFSREKIKNGLLGLKSKSSSSKYPYYSYNSTESTLMQARVKNEDGEKQLSEVTYDIGKQKARPNLLKNNAQFLISEAANEARSIKEKVLRLSRNPFEMMEEAESLKKNDDDDESVA